MFPEFRDLITQLKVENAHFSRLFEEHNKLDHKIANLENNPITSGLNEIEELKKQKLKIKDELYVILKREAEKRKELNLNNQQLL